LGQAGGLLGFWFLYNVSLVWVYNANVYISIVVENILITVPIALSVGVAIWAGTVFSQRWGKGNVEPVELPARRAFTKAE